MVLTPQLIRQIKGIFPESLHYVEQISFDKVFDPSPIKEHILAREDEDELAQHLICSPHFLIISRSKDISPKEGAFYVRAFPGKISLSSVEKTIYKKYYPTNKFLLIAPTIPEAALLSNFLESGATVKNIEKLLK